MVFLSYKVQWLFIPENDEHGDPCKRTSVGSGKYYFFSFQWIIL